ncbi:MAG: nidogen-like domain-containing protein, partial [Longimicrobiales bacterium]
MRGMVAVIAIAAGAVLAAAPVQAQVRANAGFNGNTLAANDDGSTGAVALGWTVNFFGSMYATAFVNNNGNITFDGTLGTYTPFNLQTTSRAIIAPFFADVDTRGGISDLVRYGTDLVDGRQAFGVNWLGVGYYSTHTDKVNSFQLVMIDRSDIGAGDFDFEFNYGDIAWETGDASGGSGGFGGAPARAGYSNGVDTNFEIAGSAVSGGLLDLETRSNIGVDGRYLFQVRNGVVTNPTVTPEPVSILLLASGLLGLGGVGLRRRSRGDKG